MIVRTLSALFPGQVPDYDAAGDRPLLLEHGRVWWIRSGRVDVFATEVRDGVPVGRRFHLFRAAAGEPLFGVGVDPDSGMGLLAVGCTGTTLAGAELHDLRGLAADAHFHSAVTELLHAWIGRVYEGMTGGTQPRRFRSIEPGEELTVEAGSCIRPTTRIGWVEQLHGRSRLLGRAVGEVRAGEVLPVADLGWAESVEGCTVRLVATEYLLANEVLSGQALLWGGLDRLHRMMIGVAAERLREADQAQRQRTEAQARNRRVAMSTALSGLVVSMTGREGAAPAAGGFRADGEDAALAAFRLVARAAGIRTESPVAHPAEGRCREPVEDLARAHRVRVRRVMLRHGWWRSDAGPLLGSLEAGKHPVALLPAAGGGYEVHDPRTRERTRVDAEIAASLDPFAHALYRPFSPGSLRLGDVLRFGLQGSRRDLWTVIAMTVGVALLGLATPLAIRSLYDSIIPGAERGQLLQLTLALLVTGIAGSVFHMVRGVSLLRIEARMGAALQAAVWDRLLALPLPFFRDYTAGNLAVRAMGVEEIRRVLSGTVVTTLLGGLFSVSNFGLLFLYDAALALVASLLIAAALAATLSVSYLQLRKQRAILQLRSRASGAVLQLLTGIAKLKMVGAEVQAFGVWARMFGEQREIQLRMRTLGNCLAVFRSVFPVVCSMLIFAVAAPRLTGDNPIGTGEFLGFMAAFNLCLSATLSSSTALISVLSVIPLYEQVKPILQAEPEAHAGKSDPGELSGAIELQHVTFRYHADGPQVLRDVSLRIHPGEFVAFVGPSGSGKSTILRLLLGFEAPESGTVTYDEQDIAGLDIQAVRRQIGAVWQSGRLMAGTVLTNIVGSSLATLDEAWEAARIAGLDEDIRQMPMGMYTVVSEGGGTFSGGQRQRLMIARAVVNRPRILLFDEATSALDNRTQAVVSQSLDRLKATRIVVAHRLSTVMNADRIYVVQDGRIVESGTYGELLDREGVFHEMARRQIA
ncbi:MAG TPA: NHLP bacteriocin export ABC transporter permease/ATPase subunit [Longimicrobiaceae bacterium]|nr:NHLP bacteriocin export ABC transporter permease/ATPase subunit [Longimicrobiaceae bacterium]